MKIFFIQYDCFDSNHYIKTDLGFKTIACSEKNAINHLLWECATTDKIVLQINSITLLDE